MWAEDPGSPLGERREDVNKELKNFTTEVTHLKGCVTRYCEICVTPKILAGQFTLN